MQQQQNEVPICILRLYNIPVLEKCDKLFLWAMYTTVFCSIIIALSQL